MGNTGFKSKLIIGEPITASSASSLFEARECLIRATSTPCTLFSATGLTGPEGEAKLKLAKQALKNIRALRHPGILKYIDSFDSTEPVDGLVPPASPSWEVHIVTEPVSSIAAAAIPALYPSQIALGLHSIISALRFLHEECNLAHGSLSISSLYIHSSSSPSAPVPMPPASPSASSSGPSFSSSSNASSKWIIGNLECSCPANLSGEPLKQHISSIKQFSASASASSPSLPASYPPSFSAKQRDYQLLALLLQSLLGLTGSHSSPLKLWPSTSLDFHLRCPDVVQWTQSALSFSPSATLDALLTTSLFTSDPTKSSDTFVSTCVFLHRITLYSPEEKQRFFNSLASRLTRTLPPTVILNLLLPLFLSTSSPASLASPLSSSLISSFPTSTTTTSSIVSEPASWAFFCCLLTPRELQHQSEQYLGSPLSQIAGQGARPLFSLDEFLLHILPFIDSSLASRNRGRRLFLLHCLPSYLAALPPQMARSILFPQLLAGLRDSDCEQKGIVYTTLVHIPLVAKRLIDLDAIASVVSVQEAAGVGAPLVPVTDPEAGLKLINSTLLPTLHHVVVSHPRLDVRQWAIKALISVFSVHPKLNQSIALSAIETALYDSLPDVVTSTLDTLSGTVPTHVTRADTCRYFLPLVSPFAAHSNAHISSSALSCLQSFISSLSLSAASSSTIPFNAFAPLGKIGSLALEFPRGSKTLFSPSTLFRGGPPNYLISSSLSASAQAEHAAAPAAAKRQTARTLSQEKEKDKEKKKPFGAVVKRSTSPPPPVSKMAAENDREQEEEEEEEFKPERSSDVQLIRSSPPATSSVVPVAAQPEKAAPSLQFAEEIDDDNDSWGNDDDWVSHDVNDSSSVVAVENVVSLSREAPPPPVQEPSMLFEGNKNSLTMGTLAIDDDDDDGIRSPSVSNAFKATEKKAEVEIDFFANMAPKIQHAPKVQVAPQKVVATPPAVAVAVVVPQVEEQEQKEEEDVSAVSSNFNSKFAFDEEDSNSGAMMNMDLDLGELGELS